MRALWRCRVVLYSSTRLQDICANLPGTFNRAALACAGEHPSPRQLDRSSPTTARHPCANLLAGLLMQRQAYSGSANDEITALGLIEGPSKATRNCRPSGVMPLTRRVPSCWNPACSWARSCSAMSPLPLRRLRFEIQAPSEYNQQGRQPQNACPHRVRSPQLKRGLLQCNVAGERRPEPARKSPHDHQ
jgi:hypothetical protein